MKRFQLLAFMALVCIGQTVICSEEYEKRRDQYQQKLSKQLRGALEDNIDPVSLCAALISSERAQELAAAVYNDQFNILHQEEFQHCSNTVFTKFFKSHTPECAAVRESIASLLRFNPKVPDLLERYEKSREHFYAARKAANL